MLDEAYHWAETQFGRAAMGDARRTDRLVSTMAAIARAPDESLPRQLGSAAGANAAYRLFDCAAVTREAVMDPHLAQVRAAAAQHPVVLMVQDDTTLDFSSHRRLRGAGRVGDDRGTGFLAHSCLAVLPAGETLGLAHQTIWARPPKGMARQTRESAVWADTVATIGRPPPGTLFVSVTDRGADIFRAPGERPGYWLGRGGAGGAGPAPGPRRWIAGGAARDPGDGRRHRPDKAGRGVGLRGLARAGTAAAAPRSRGPGADPGPRRAPLERHSGMAAADHPAGRDPRPGTPNHLGVLSTLGRRRVSQSLENRLPGRAAAAGGSRSPGAAARGPGHRRRPSAGPARCRPLARRRPGRRAGDHHPDPRRQASAASGRLHHQPGLPARRRPPGRLPRPQVGRRARLANDLERLVRPLHPRRRLRTRSGHCFSPMKCG